MASLSEPWSGLPSYGQNSTRLSPVSQPQSGHRFSSRSLPRKGMIGMNRKRKKYGSPRYQRSRVMARDPASRSRLSCHVFVLPPP